MGGGSHVREKVRPRPPGTGLTEDGRRLQVLTTYARRGSRLTPAQQGAWDQQRRPLADPETAVDERAVRRVPLVPFDGAQTAVSARR